MRAGIASLALFALAACGTAPSSGGNPNLGNVQKSVAAFVNACVSTSASPANASGRFEELGFSGGPSEFRSSYARAQLSENGQCNLTPNGGNFSSVVAELKRQMTISGVQARELGGEEAWLLPGGAVVLVSRSGGAMTRTAPGVFRG